MCGFTGIFRPRGTATGFEAELAAMARTLIHRGPDSEGVWCDEPGTLGLGHRRLSIQDLSPLGHQPMHSASGRYVIALNGEIYNFLDLRRELEQHGAAFRGHSDTEVVLSAVDHWGVEESLKRFVGMFAFALCDVRDRKLYLARDRMGEKPLYYGWQGNSFVFGSELKALRACREWKEEIDRNVIPLFLRFNYIPAPYSIYRGIYKLPAGSLLTLSERADKTVSKEITTYWSVEHAFRQGAQNPLDGSPEEIVERLEELLRDSIRRQMISDVPLGAFLSGGVDSSTVVALMQSMASSPVKTFTLGFDIPGYDEAKAAKAVSAHLGTDHTELYVTPEQAMGIIPALGDMYDEPFADSSQIPTHLVSRIARRHVTVSLSGDGGDELFCGYNHYFDYSRQWLRQQRLPGPVRRIASGLGMRIPEALATTLLYPFFAMSGSNETENLGARFHKRMESWRQDDLKCFYRHCLSLWGDPQRLVPGALESGAPFGNFDSTSPLDVYGQLRCLDATTYLPDDILVKVDRAAMAVSLETRIPLLDHRLVEFALRIPQGILAYDNVGKWPLRRILYKYVPRQLIDRPKSGFAIPIAEWLKGPLKPWAEELLSSQRLKRDGILDPQFVEREWKCYLTGQVAHSHHRLWGILMFQSWLDSTRSKSSQDDKLSDRSFSSQINLSNGAHPASKICSMSSDS